MPTISLYHGSNSKFDLPTLGNKGTNSYGILGDESVDRHGIFFSDSKEFANQFGKHVNKFKVNINDPLELTRDVRLDFLETIDAFDERDLWLSVKYIQPEWQLFDGTVGERFVKWVLSQGYDSAVFEETVETSTGEELSGNTYVVFDDAQVIRKVISSNHLLSEYREYFR